MESFEFISPVLNGPRFNDHAVPLELIQEFTILEELILDIAKTIYLRDNQNRERVPKGFADNLSLKLKTIEEGSVKLNIILMVGISGLFPDSYKSYYEKAKESLIESIHSASIGKPTSLTEKQLRYFTKFGKRLKTDEHITFKDKDQNDVIFNSEIRQKLILSNGAIQNFEKEFKGFGYVTEIDKDSQSFTFKNFETGSTFLAKYDEFTYDTIFNSFCNYNKDSTYNQFLEISGIAQFDRSNRLVSLLKLDRVTVPETWYLRAKLRELSLLNDDWFDSTSKAPNYLKLSWFIDNFDLYFDTENVKPYIFPLIEGGIQLEWKPPGKSITLDILNDSSLGYFHKLDFETSEVEECEIDLKNQQEWTKLNQLLSI